MSRGTPTDFVENEILLATNDRRGLQGVLRRTRGKLVKTLSLPGGRTKHGTLHLIRVPATSGASAAAASKGLAEDLRRIEPAANARIRLSGGEALHTLAEAADESARGLHVGLNILFDPNEPTVAEINAAFPGQQFLDGERLDAPGENLDYLADHEVLAAWKSLEVAGRLKNRVRVGLIDSGFMQTQDISPGSIFTSFEPGADKPTHGFRVSQTLAAIPDNGFGVAGTGGPVADLTGFYTQHNGLDVIAWTYILAESGVPIINMSFGSYLDGAVSFAAVPFEDATQEAASLGTLVVASAGNLGLDVDEEHCWPICTESEWKTPCENEGVLCVGGLEGNAARKKAPGSDYGFGTCGHPDCTVRLFAPFNVRVFDTAENAGMGGIVGSSGTSHSAPFVSGIAALVLAADPSLSGVQAGEILVKTADTYESSDMAQPGGTPGYVPRWVDAFDAVREALPSVPPALGIVTPDGTPAANNPEQERDFRAVAISAYSGDSCCYSFDWSSSRDGYLGSGESIKAKLIGGPGERVITVKATGGFTSATDSVTLNLINGLPSPVIHEPSNGQTLYRGPVYKFRGEAFDFDQGIGALDCSALTWKVVGPGLTTTTLHGCQPEIEFTTNGPRTVTLTAVDAEGAEASTTLNVNVTDQPTNSAPIPTILAPDDGGTLFPNQNHTLRGTSTGDQRLLSYTWVVTGTVDEQVIGSGSQITWDPADHVPFSCGGREVTLQLQTREGVGPIGTDSITVRVPYSPC